MALKLSPSQFARAGGISYWTTPETVPGGEAGGGGETGGGGGGGGGGLELLPPPQAAIVAVNSSSCSILSVVTTALFAVHGVVLSKSGISLVRGTHMAVLQLACGSDHIGCTHRGKGINRQKTPMNGASCCLLRPVSFTAPQYC